jgi:hypothetical protein
MLLDTQSAVRQLAYPGELQLAEDEVKRAVEAALWVDGWSLEMLWGYARGVGIEACHGTERLMLEIRGEGTLAPMRVNFLLGAWGELLQCIDTPHAGYGLTLPTHRQFVGLVLRLPVWVRARPNLCFFFVRITDNGRFEVGFFAPGDGQS